MSHEFQVVLFVISFLGLSILLGFFVAKMLSIKELVHTIVDEQTKKIIRETMERNVRPH